MRHVCSGWLSLLAVVMLAGPARAEGATPEPPIEGHVTDPGHRLSHIEKASLESLLERLQGETKVDVAALVVDVPPQQLEATGRAAFDRWHIGRDWENGVLITLSADASAMRLIMAPQNPVLGEQDATRIRSADGAQDPHLSVADSLRGTVERIAAVVRVGAKLPKARPPGGARRPLSALAYGGLLTLIGLYGFVRSWRRTRKRPS